MAFWYTVAFRMAAVLPVWLKRVIAGLIAWGYFAFNVTQRRGVFANLRIMRPEMSHRQLSRLALRTFAQAGMNLLDFFGIPSTSDARIESMIVNFADMRALLDERSDGRPFCLVAAHYGHWELAGAMLGLGGYRTHAIALSQSSGVVERLYESLRMRFGMTAHDVRFGLRDLLRHLPEGEVPAIVSDRDYTGSGEEVEFFGKPVLFPRGAALLSFRRKLVGIPGFLVRQPDGRFLLEFGRPINPEASDERSWVRAFVMDFAQQYEAIVDQDPTQFLNFFDFWSTAT
ncbi:MAG: lysophospholipid acyltransferase family protein [Candidatus Cryosericum sp.]